MLWFGTLLWRILILNAYAKLTINDQYVLSWINSYFEEFEAWAQYSFNPIIIPPWPCHRVNVFIQDLVILSSISGMFQFGKFERHRISRLLESMRYTFCKQHNMFCNKLYDWKWAMLKLLFCAPQMLDLTCILFQILWMSKLHSFGLISSWAEKRRPAGQIDGWTLSRLCQRFGQRREMPSCQNENVYLRKQKTEKKY